MSENGDKKTYKLTLDFDPHTFSLRIGGDSYSPEMSLAILEQALRELKFQQQVQRVAKAQHEAMMAAQARGMIHRA